jgi:hypothetical protein
VSARIFTDVNILTHLLKHACALLALTYTCIYTHTYNYIFVYIQVALGDLDDMFSSPSPRVKPANTSDCFGVTSTTTNTATATATSAAAPVEVFADPPRNGQSSNAQNSNGPLDFVMFEDSSSPGNVPVQVVALQSMLTASCTA